MAHDHKVWAIYHPGKNGEPGMGGKSYLCAQHKDLFGADADKAHVLDAFKAGRMPKFSKPYPETIRWAIYAGFTSMIPQIVAACEKVAAKIGDQDNYASQLAKAKVHLAKPAFVPPAPKGESFKLVEVGKSPGVTMMSGTDFAKALGLKSGPNVEAALIPDKIDTDDVPPEVTVVFGRWLDLDGPIFPDGECFTEETKAFVKAAASKVGTEQKLLTAHESDAVRAAREAKEADEALVAKSGGRWSLIELD